MGPYNQYLILFILLFIIIRKHFLLDFNTFQNWLTTEFLVVMWIFPSKSKVDTSPVGRLNVCNEDFCKCCRKTLVKNVWFCCKKNCWNMSQCLIKDIYIMWSPIKNVKQKLCILCMYQPCLWKTMAEVSRTFHYSLAGCGAVLLSDTDKLENKGWTTNKVLQAVQE